MLFAARDESLDFDEGIGFLESERHDGSDCYDQFAYGFSLLIIAKKLRDRGYGDEAEFLMPIVEHIHELSDENAEESVRIPVSLGDMLRMCAAFFHALQIVLGESEVDRMRREMERHCRETLADAVVE